MKFFYGVLGCIFFLNSFQSEAQFFAKGADIGWLSEMEASDKLFYNDQGIEQDVLQILKDHCINSIRLRVWVNPANGWSGKEDVINMARRASDMGFQLMIDFHYSDNWADPGKQFIPADWTNYNVTQMSQAVYDHTVDVLTTLKDKGVTPSWVQIGNETNDGMLWDLGKASSNMANYALFVTSGHNAAHAVFPDIISIVHVSNGYDNSLFRWNIGGLIDNGANFDAIGMSLYPEPDNWQTLTQQCLTNMNDMVSRYNKPVAITEIGMSYTSPAEAKAFVEDIITKNKSLANNMGLGVFWWEPQTYNWRGYDKGAWGTNGKPTVALDGFLINCTNENPDCNNLPGGTAYIDNCGTCVEGNTGKSACEPVFVTIHVDMTGQNTSGGTYITGTITNWQITPMAHLGEALYSYTLSLFPGDTGAYYFLNENDWNARETVPEECAVYWDVDRGLEVPEQDTTISNVWGSCKEGTITNLLPDVEEKYFSVYPNPFEESLLLNGHDILNYKITNMTGTTISTGNCANNCSVGADIAPGVYFLILYFDSRQEVVKIIKK